MKLRELEWVGSSLQDLKEFPDLVLDEIGYALHLVQEGKKPRNAKPLKGLDSGVMEIVADFDTNTYRAVYAVKIGNTVYVLHCFQKKSTKGISTPKKEIDLIKKRLQAVKEKEKKTKE